jgi:hypothetical protein
VRRLAAIFGVVPRGKTLHTGLAVSLATLACLLVPGTTAAATCNVPTASYPSVQSAVDDASCDPIVIAPGILIGSVSVNRSVTIQGAGANQTFLVGTTGTTTFEAAGGMISASGLNISHSAIGFTNVGVTVQPGVALNLSDSIIHDNNSTTGAGATVAGVLNLSRSSVVSNTATATSLAGGGIQVTSGGNLNATDSTISGNEATGATGGQGGGLAVTGITSSVSLTNVTISGNSTKTFGGGFEVADGSVNMNDVTIAGNGADADGDGTGDGGGIYIKTAAAVNVRNSIIASNTDAGGQAPDCGTELASHHLTRRGYVLLRDQTGCNLGGTGDDPTGYMTGVDPLLAGLADNGGPTQTMALPTGSPALDVTPVVACGVVTDQRGVSRPQGSGCDLGAFELQVNPPGPDLTPPETHLGKAKINRKKRRAKFKFSSSEPGSSFLCKLDKKKFKPCSSPKTYKHLRPGKHTFKVEAKDGAGNIDPSPAKKKFRI